MRTSVVFVRQSPCGLRKSGNPESTLMPAPAVTGSASARAIKSATRRIERRVWSAKGACRRRVSRQV
jgi:hypothetical protein